MLVAPWGVASCQDILRMLAENGIPPSSLIWRFLGGACELVTSLDVLFGKLEMDFFFCCFPVWGCRDHLDGLQVKITNYTPFVDGL